MAFNASDAVGFIASTVVSRPGPPSFRKAAFAVNAGADLPVPSKSRCHQFSPTRDTSCLKPQTAPFSTLRRHEARDWRDNEEPCTATVREHGDGVGKRQRLRTWSYATHVLSKPVNPEEPVTLSCRVGATEWPYRLRGPGI